ncbi:MAG: cation:proton antiporter [Myxococcota bacterium]
MATEPATTLLTLGALLLAGLAADVIGRRTRLPRVTLLLLLGVAAGPVGLELLPKDTSQWFPLIADVALAMVAFLLGGELTRAALREHGRAVLTISLVVVGVTVAVVGAGLRALGWSWELALLLAGIATSTAPAAVSDVIREVGARGPFTKTLLGIVALDDAWGLVTLSLLLALLVGVQSPEAARGVALAGLVDVGGAVLVGCGIGIPTALLTGRVREGEPTQAEALGAVFLCAGVSLLLDVSFLLAGMVMGVVVANLAQHHRRPFRAIEGIEWPLMVLFFVLSGASLQPAALGAAAWLTAAYVVLRVAGRVLGGFVGARWVRSADLPGRWIGPALLPQAGVAIGMALVVAGRRPEVGEVLLTATVAATVVFEIIGPILTRLALVATGEVAPAERS